MGANDSKKWHTPKRVATQSKQGLVVGISSLPSGLEQKQLNKFEVLQEQLNGGKEEGKRSLWKGLQRISLSVKAWIILGNFNALFSCMDRSGGKTVSALDAHTLPLSSSVEETNLLSEIVESLLLRIINANNLSGPIPTYLGSITTLTRLSMESILFSGTIPSEIGKLVNLEYLTLAANNFTREFPDLTSLTKLKELRISSNYFTGRMPEFGNLKQLQML
ncbi:leucine-rich repeat receptor-like serine/threonine-protein kinase At1g17230 [Humulus lupulus]|uniref:leucine-rich repeat receptor-like serine/threonine-protein kinase At1g17230 n=1 Tax=Humulus lupulus TaxID=3486 RepID=UPI002B401116|nr:leucine-rich repeat receptor-like serine/threonine-protein kinase At1g17230 [Humulus lupulus]